MRAFGSALAVVWAQVIGIAIAASAPVALTEDFLQPVLQEALPSWTIVGKTSATAAEKQQASAVVSYGGDDFAALSREAPHVQLYQIPYTGYDSLNLSAIPMSWTVCNCHQSGVAISEYNMAGMLQWVTAIQKMNQELHSCTWKTSPPGNDCTESMHDELLGKRLGVLGYGHIGSNTAVRAAAFGMEIAAVTHTPPATPPAPLKWIGGDEDLEKLAAWSDFFLVSVPLLNSTRGMVNAQLLSKAKKGQVLINIARGPIVDEDALFAALQSKQLGGAILDVWWNEEAFEEHGGVGPSHWPSRNDYSVFGDRVMMSPHSSSATPQSRARSLKDVVSNLQRLAAGEPLQNVIRNSTYAEWVRWEAQSKRQVEVESILL